ncbi:complement component C7 [Odontesthes bonariensis]|uniref:complement component C7 n=1 Tax=Odontesthes bonariensis TaxID=219752 RepID=UPI003F5830B8
MKDIAQLGATILPWLLMLFTTRVFCVQRVHCQWGPYGSWSNCDPCSRSQTRSRAMAVYAQFGGNPCDGQSSESRPCETTQGCPLDQGCGNRFRCRSGKCISKSLLCNGDQDCEEDGLDERDCSTGKFVICDYTIPPPNSDLLGLGYDEVSGKRRASVINSRSFGGQCRPTFSGDHRTIYRLPLSTIQYNFLVKVQNDFSDEMFTSKWHYAKDVVNRETVTGTTSGYRNYDFHETHDKTENYKLLVFKSEVEVAQFQSNSPKYLPLSEEFWKALGKLPNVYDYSAYRKILERFGTQYVSEGSLGGSFKVIVSINEQTENYISLEKYKHDECERTKRWILFFPLTIEKCVNDEKETPYSWDKKSDNNVAKVDVEGGGVSHIAALERLDITDPNKNSEMYSNWAESVRSFPQVIKQTLRPLSELVKEVQCAGVKKLYLRRAIQQYISESHPCHCQPCSNNGMAVMDGNTCKCICKTGTKGLACEQGAEAGGQQGVIHGSWSCWSAWSHCSGGRSSRTRSCSNPYPQNGGQHCIGEPTESSQCDDDELQYLMTMEPQCFDNTLPPSHKCETPSSLINGFIQNPKDIYFVTDKAEYSCTSGFHLVGQSILECTADLTWSGRLGQCTLSVCKLNSLATDVVASPLNPIYSIGDRVTLSCPEGRTLEGEAVIICDPSLNFSPDPAEIRCSQADTAQQPTAPTVQCKAWEKLFKGRCICKMANECSSSLELCVTSSVSSTFFPISVCKMHALQCAGKNVEIAEHSSCNWPQRKTEGCTNCHMWEKCDDQTNMCRCKNPEDCSNPGLSVCVRVGENAAVATQTMSECEAGLRQCKGEHVSIVSILPCAS